MTLVRIRCRARGCGRLLLEVAEVPADWSASLKVPACAKHGGVRNGTFRRWAIARRSQGKPLEVSSNLVPWSELREPIELAQRVAEPVDAFV